MSIICYYVRADPAGLEALRAHPDAIFDYPEEWPAGVEVIDIDKAYDALAWLASPLKRAEAQHMARLIRDQSWPDARASAEALSKMTVDDLLVAIEGGATETTETVDWGLGGNAFSPARVAELARALTELDERSLRYNFDPAEMDRNDVQPGDWLEDAEQTLTRYLLPALGSGLNRHPPCDGGGE